MNDLTQKPTEAQQAEPAAWLVLDKDGALVHAAAWREAAHEHINDAINEHGITEAARWVVRPAFTAPVAAAPAPAPQPVQDERAAFEAWLHKCHPGAVGAELIGKEENSPDTYVFFGVNKQWAAWQARAALAATPAPAPLTTASSFDCATEQERAAFFKWFDYAFDPEADEMALNAFAAGLRAGQGKEASNGD